MAILKREDIFACKESETLTLEVPEWGGEVIVALMTSSDMDAYESSLLTNKGKLKLANARAKLLAAALVDETGKQIFTAADVAALGRKSSKAVTRIYNAVLKFNSINEKDLDDLVKN